MAEARNVIAAGFEMEKVKKEKATVYIVDVIRPKGVNLEKADIHVLVPILGSEKAAKEAIIYHYKFMGGFAAKLTPSQVKHLKKQPGVFGFEPDRISTHLMYGPGG
ncbi:Pi starvation-induced protein [Rhynchospora pubera]|uniref:Pi starvation-induced protein n=1 Tax=Rhynchospora pubera TaxID=906938 RepID=A0AAV8G995_9POAL|nr:Pi starvation-induced protein [Rhynchospora pubera]